MSSPKEIRCVMCHLVNVMSQLTLEHSSTHGQESKSYVTLDNIYARLVPRVSESSHGVSYRGSGVGDRRLAGTMA